MAKRLMRNDIPSETLIEIYGLFCPSGKLRYIGKAVDSKIRFAGHMRERRRATPLYSWIASLRKRNQVPTVRVLDRCPVGDWERTEKQLIFEARLTGERLLNLADGGNQPKANREQNSRNGHALNRALKADPILMRLTVLKRRLMISMRKGWVGNKTREKMRLIASIYPQMCGEWACISDEGGEHAC